MAPAVLALISGAAAVLQEADKWTPALEALLQAAKPELSEEEVRAIEQARDAAVAAQQKRLSELREEAKA